MQCFRRTDNPVTHEGFTIVENHSKFRILSSGLSGIYRKINRSHPLHPERSKRNNHLKTNISAHIIDPKVTIRGGRIIFKILQST